MCLGRRGHTHPELQDRIGHPQAREAALKIRTGAAEEDAGSHFDQGIARTASGESETAAASLREAVRQRPALALAHYNLGYAPSLPQRWPDAEAACREAIRLHPDLPEAHFIIALALAQAGGYEDAISS